MVFDKIAIPENMSLVVTNYLPGYRLSCGDQMMKILGSGTIKGHGEDGAISSAGLQNTSLDGEFEILLSGDLNKGLTTTSFENTVFSGLVRINVEQMGAVNFTSCVFLDGCKVVLSGGPTDIGFYGCVMESDSLIDVELLQFENLAVDECESTDTSHFILPERASFSSGWLLPAAAAGLVGVLSMIKSRTRGSVQATKKEHSETCNVEV